MSIVIPHRFYKRLLPPNDIEDIQVLIIGTFNPGIPNRSLLTSEERIKFELIEKSKKFQKFNLVKNFYDRPQNRFWKVMDYCHNNSFYSSNGVLVRNNKGLKYYKGMDRDMVLRNQLDFCRNNRIFITDFVKEIRPKSFTGIYDNFSDSVIERSNPIWNTDGIIEIITRFTPQTVIINFKIGSNSIPNISSQANVIKSTFPNKVVTVQSTSGAAGNTYKDLIDSWLPYILNNSRNSKGKINPTKNDFEQK